MLGGIGEWLRGLDTSPRPGLASMLGQIGAAVSPQDSWQQRLGQAGAHMGQQEQARQYLAELLAGAKAQEAVAQTYMELEDEEEQKQSKLGSQQLQDWTRPAGHQLQLPNLMRGR